MDHVEKQIREAFIDGFMSAYDQLEGTHVNYAFKHGLAEKAWTKENTTESAEIQTP